MKKRPASGDSLQPCERYWISLGLLALLPTCASATPMVVARFDKGVIVGTNEVQADGSKTCKIHAARHSIVLMTSSPPAGADPVSEGIVSKAASQIEQAIGGQSLSIVELTTLVSRTMEAVSREAASTADDAFAFRFVLVDIDSSGPAVSAFLLKRKIGGAGALDLAPIEQAVQVNELHDFSQQNVRLKHIAPGEEAAIEAVRQQLVLDTRIQSAKPTQAYQPPFSIVEIRNDGSITLITPPGECNQEKINPAAGQ